MNNCDLSSISYSFQEVTLSNQKIPVYKHPTLIESPMRKASHREFCRQTSLFHQRLRVVILSLNATLSKFFIFSNI